MRVLVTGGSGFVGRPTVTALLARGVEVHTIGRRPVSGAVHHDADLLDPASMQAGVRAAAATHLLHLAWYVEPGRYWQSPRNLDWIAASLGLARTFVDAGGRRIVGAGTCAEHAWGAPHTLYGVAKDALRRVLEAFGATEGVGVAWGRIFYVHGPGEAPGRLVGEAIRTLSAGGRLPTSHGRQRRDFLHVADVAGAFAALLSSDLRGPVDIGSGQAPAVREVLEAVARHTGGLDRIDWGARPLAPDEPASIGADPARLRAAGFTPRFGLVDGIADTVQAWTGQDSVVVSR